MNTYQLSMGNSHAGQNPGDGRIDSLMCLVMAAYLIKLYDHAAPAPPSEPEIEHYRLSRAQLECTNEYIRSHLDQSMSVADLAHRCAMSRATFARAFKQRTGVTPLAWVRRQRIEFAKQFLVYCPNWTLATIAAECGFADQSHLCRVFSKMVGASPAVWRLSMTTGKQDRAPSA